MNEPVTRCGGDSCIRCSAPLGIPLSGGNIKSSLEASQWLSGKESACQCKRHGVRFLIREAPHAGEQLSLCTTTTSLCLRAQELQPLSPPATACPRASAPQEKPLQKAAWVHNYGGAPITTTRQKSEQQ